MSVPFEQLPAAAGTAWERLRDELVPILGDDLVAIWAYGGTVAVEGPARSADLDTYVIVRRPIDPRIGKAIDGVEAAIAADTGAAFDSWYVLEDDARGPEAPRHAYRSDRRDTTWAVNRAHWLAGRYAHVYGREPAEIVPAPTWSDLEAELDREVEHLERHVAEGDTDAFEATYAILNGSRILRTLATRDPAISKRSAGEWALKQLPVRWHAVLRAAGRAYDGLATPKDNELLAAEMGPFVAMVRERLPSAVATEGGRPRWSGY